MVCIADEGTRESVDSACRKLTASWVREAAQRNPEVETCGFFEGLERSVADAVRSHAHTDRFLCVHATPLALPQAAGLGINFSQCHLVVCNPGIPYILLIYHMSLLNFSTCEV